MPSDDGKEVQSNLDLTVASSTEREESDDSLPPLVPPQTKTPFQFNQQVNINQIPPRVWDKLSSAQIAELTTSILAQVERTDQRHFEFAKERASQAAKNSTLAMCIGGVVALAGLGAVAYLAATGNGIVAGTLGGFLATIIAVIIGRKIAD